MEGHHTADGWQRKICDRIGNSAMRVVFKALQDALQELKDTDIMAWPGGGHQ
jgi:hypothetical protein